MREEKASALPLLLDVRRMDENNRAYAYRMLRKNIMTLQLQPGCQLSEAELCEQLAMSRTPVHEALMMLKPQLKPGYDLVVVCRSAAALCPRSAFHT